jgi:hypothetical protein
MPSVESANSYIRGCGTGGATAQARAREGGDCHAAASAARGCWKGEDHESHEDRAGRHRQQAAASACGRLTTSFGPLCCGAHAQGRARGALAELPACSSCAHLPCLAAAGGSSSGERRRGQLPPWRSSRGTTTALSGQSDGRAGHGAPALRTHGGRLRSRETGAAPGGPRPPAPAAAGQRGYAAVGRVRRFSSRKIAAGSFGY